MSGNTPTILIVDDIEPNRDILRNVVEAIGYQVIEATNGQEALDCIYEYPIDLVLLDIMMPVMDGFTVLATVRETHNLQQLPIIMITAMTGTDDVTQGLEGGANDYITKPFEFKIVRARVRGLLQMKQLYDDRQRLLNTMQHANDLKNRLMRIASHDLKNPISNLHMVMQLLQPAIPMSSENKELVDMAYRYIDNMSGIVEEFLDLDVLKDQEIVFNMTDFPLDEVVLSIMKDYRTPADRKGIRLVAAMDSVTIHADKERMEQIIANLISNAIKYTPQGTVVNVTGELYDDTYTLHVMDQGAGIPENEVRSLFEPFGKLSTQPTGGENSTGLGLWIVKQLVEAQGGTVGVNMDYTEGADFWVQMPIPEQP